ncbi:hypothetical protein [Sphaerisporangium aureirubrum]|uniref:Uncharacterized protein n=1 Tax=Sphaerisporangium aureirubrum TaxID=1544736 RepID=A0ABW1ND65_9ACTN
MTSSAQTARDAADRDLRAARATLDSTASAYDVARRTPGGLHYEKARAAWTLALLDWTHTLIRQSGLVDAVTAERRSTDRDAADALLLPTRRTP